MKPIVIMRFPYSMNMEEVNKSLHLVVDKLEKDNYHVLPVRCSSIVRFEVDICSVKDISEEEYNKILENCELIKQD